MRRTDSLEKTLMLIKIDGRRTRGTGDDRGWDGWMASPTQWTQVWANSGRPGMLQSMGLQSQTQLSNWTELWMLYLWFSWKKPFFSLTQEMKRSPGPEGRFAYNHCERAAWDPGDTSPQTDPSSDFYAVVCNGDQEWRRRENSGLIKQRIWNEAAPCVGVNKDSIWVEIWSNFLNIGCHVNKMS